MTDEELKKETENIERICRIDEAYEIWHAGSAVVKDLEKYTVEDLMREAFFNGYEQGEKK